MEFDTELSDTVSLSKILDAFILDSEKPNIILSFISQYRSRLTDVFTYSLYWTRIAQLDFFLKCSAGEQRELVSILDEFAERELQFLRWQVLSSRSRRAAYGKYFMGKSRLDESVPIRHPYRFGYTPSIRVFDKLCHEYSSHDNMVGLALSAGENHIIEHFKSLEYSLFSGRIAQLDFLENLPIAEKYVLIRELFEHCGSHIDVKTLIRLSMQIFASDESSEVKHMVMDKISCLTDKNDFLACNVAETVDECDSFPELMLRLTVLGMESSPFVVAYLLLFRFKLLAEWRRSDPDSLRRILDIVALVDICITDKARKK